MDSIEGLLVSHRVVGDDFWSVATVQTPDGDSVGVTGKLLGVQVGDSVRCDGTFTDHPRFGRQLKVKSCTVTVPQTNHGVIAWLSGGSRFAGIGEKTAERMVDHFGGPKKLWAIIENEHERLSEVNGITKARADEIRDRYVRFAHDRDRMIKFRSWGMTENQIAKMLKAWGDQSEERLRDNPYQLAELISGFGFLRSDAIAQRMGIPLDSPSRIRCGLTHTMKQAQGHGHCYVPHGKLLNMATTKVLRLDAQKSIVEAEIRLMRKSGDLVFRQVAKSGSTSGETVDAVFSPEIDAAEKKCAEGIAALLEEDERQGNHGI